MLISQENLYCRGWGLRCLDDIPSGGFICVYAGQILSEQGANEVSSVLRNHIIKYLIYRGKYVQPIHFE